MSDGDLKLRPHHNKGNEAWWWYEEPKGIYIVLDVSKLDSELRHKPVMEIPWRSLRAALRRKDKKSE